MARILLADDEAVLIMQLKKRLETFGHQVVGTAASGEKAVELARNFKPDLMLMDIVMPGGLDGLDASEIIKGELNTPIIFMSGHADDHVLERIKNAQPDGFIVKPINEFELKVAVEVVLSKIDQGEHFKKYRNHLEGLIEKRTAELEASNAELQIEITRREQAEEALKRLCSETERKTEDRTSQLNESSQAERLRESEETARALLNASPAAAVLTDTAGVIIAVNQVGARLLEEKAEELVGRRLEECFPICLIKHFTGQDQKGICPGDSVHFEKEYLGRFFDVTIHPVVDRQGKVARFAVFGTDITGRKRAEEALRQSETQLRMITNALPTLVAYIDSNQRYLFNNSAYQEWAGDSLDKITGKSVREFLPENIYKYFQPHIEEALSGKRVQFETKIIHPRFGLRYVSGTYLPDFGDGSVLKGFVACISDVTETKLKEECIRASLNEKVTLLREIHTGSRITSRSCPVFWS
ncbi:MAG: PAS domain-containing protein [Deltaproteobacteria bacterium]|nr:PAS domain-containing protein [Deltaproteobacteria bacterium]